MQVLPSTIVADQNMGLFTCKAIPKKIQFHYHGVITYPDPQQETLDTMYILTILNGRIEINARPVLYMNTISIQRFYPSMMNEFIWDETRNNVRVLSKKKVDNGKLEIITDILPGFEMFMQYDKNNDYDWSFAKVKRLKNALRDTSYILSFVSVVCTPRFEEIFRLVTWIVDQLPTDSIMRPGENNENTLRITYDNIACRSREDRIQDNSEEVDPFILEIKKRLPPTPFQLLQSETEFVCAYYIIEEAVFVIERSFDNKVLEPAMTQE
jgi:hypothetical protein